MNSKDFRNLMSLFMSEISNLSSVKLLDMDEDTWMEIIKHAVDYMYTFNVAEGYNDITKFMEDQIDNIARNVSKISSIRDLLFDREYIDSTSEEVTEEFIHDSLTSIYQNMIDCPELAEERLYYYKKLVLNSRNGQLRLVRYMTGLLNEDSDPNPMVARINYNIKDISDLC